MPTISKIRFTNVVYEGGNKRYADEIFHFHGENGAIVLENGGGKTVFIQTALQAIIPHTALSNRKAKDTFIFDDGPAHIAIEWIKNDRPRIYALTTVTIFPQQNGIDSYRYVYEYGPNDSNSIENLPFTHELANQQKRIASHLEMKEYYAEMSQKSQTAHTFSTITSFIEYIEKNFQIINDEWKSIITINAAEGDVEKFFEACSTEKALYEKLLIPTVEQSIAAFEQHQFANIFEKHRDKFKLLKQLSAQLKEYDLIQKELSKYVGTVYTLHEHQKQYELVKQRMKAYYNLLIVAIQNYIEKLTVVEEQEMQLQDQAKHLETKQKSYVIAVIEEELRAIAAIYDELQNEVTSLEEKLREQVLYYGNMAYANEKQLFKQAQQQLLLFENELKQMDHHYSTEQLIEQLDEVKAKLRGDALTLEQRYEQQLKDVQVEQHQKENQYNEQRPIIQQLSHDIQQLQAKITTIEANVAFNTEQLEMTAKDLFENEVQRQQPVLELRILWTESSQAIDERIVALQNEERQLSLTVQENKQKLEAFARELLDLTSTKTKVSTKLTAIEEEEKKLVAQLTTVLPRISEKTSLYLKEASLLHDLEKLLEKKEQLYAEKLLEERVAYRQVDDYGEQYSFFADPYIARKIPIWSQRFRYLETAIDYAMGDDQLTVDTHLLAITLITTDEEKEKLEQLVFNSAKHLTYPIQIWTLSEVVAISKGELNPTIKLLQPTLWQQISDVNAFKQWQEQAEHIAKDSSVQRQQADEERSHIKALLNKLRDFYSQYPLNSYQQLKEQLDKLKRQIYEVTIGQGTITKVIASAEESLRNVAKNIHTQSEQKKYYDDKIEKLLNYDKFLKKVKQLQQQLVVEQKVLEDLSKQYRQVDKQLQTISDELQQLQEQKNKLNRDYSVQVAERALYKQVTSCVPIFSEESYSILEQQFNHITNQINGINSSRHQLQSQIEQQQTYIKQHEQQLKRIQVQFNNLDEQFELPLDYERQLEELPVQHKQLQANIDRLMKRYEESKAQKNEKEVAIRLKREELINYIQFELPLPTVKYQLEEEAKRLQLQRKQLTKEKESLIDAKVKAEKLENTMQILNAEHAFLVSSISPTKLTAQEENDFSYRQQHYTEQTQKQLASYKQQIERQYKIVTSSKDAFVQYCQNNISEARLRNTIIDGIQLKDQYDDLLKHQNDMEKTIQMSRQYAERDIKKHDEDLVQFVQRVHVHLRKVVEELKHIPRKTKVHVNNEDLLIYRFTIPDWTDEEGIMQLRARIDWIMEQLEQLENRTVDEQESKQKTRKQLEEWLSTVQLLRYITQNKEWRIACRKVMNDNRISPKFESWSRSNAWSGGEKWSKNMALFLGVLNYVAEKRQYISPKKKSRTVILDNPFGKASSDHVLSPVFFIAKQLGFQIIALTAHVEGKFLHDYFPVVYSCRLRAAIGTDKQVMETKKTIHQAYFRDHNEELGEVVQVEQLNLFSE